MSVIYRPLSLGLIGISSFALAATLGMPIAHAQTIINNQTVTVPPDPAPTGNLTVGSTGTGELNIVSGGVVTTNLSTLGDSAGSSGTVNVSGTGTWTANGITVGNQGTGVLNVTGGGQVTSSGMTVGSFSNALGTVTIDGSGSLFTSTSSVVSGSSGNGTVNVTNGATFDVGNNTFYISDGDSTGTFNVSGGSTVASGVTYIGYCGGGCSSSVGIANISGAGTVWNAGSLTVGYEDSEGTLNISAGAVVSSSGDVVVGYFADSPGHVSVTGTGSQLVLSGTADAYIGLYSSADVTVSDGASFQVARDTYISYATGSDSSLTITGAGTEYITGGLYVGYGGNGTMSILAGAGATSGSAYVGYSAGSTGTATIDGGTWAMSGATLTIGENGTGTVTVTNGGSIGDSSSPLTQIYLGNNANSFGALTITGAGSEVYVSSGTYVGGNGQGALNVLGGGYLETGYLYAGRSNSGAGTVLIDGAGSHVLAKYSTYVGYNSTGTATVSGGGWLEVDSSITVGSSAAGTLTVTGAGSQVTTTSYLTVGNSAEGSLTISDGGNVSVDHGNSAAEFGSNGGASGSLVVTGAGSELQADWLILGRFGSGVATLSNGGKVTVDQVRIGYDNGFGDIGDGTLNIGAAAADPAAAAGILDANLVRFGGGNFGSGEGRINFNLLGAFTFSPELYGQGNLNVIAGTTTFATDSTNYSGDVTVTGGKAVFNAILPGDVTVSGAGVVGGSGTIASLDAQSGGTVAPGNSSGTLNVAGNVSFASGTIYAVEVAGAASDLILAGGTATLTGGTVQVSGSPSLMRYAIITSTGARTGFFDGIETTSAFMLYSLDYDPNNVYLVVDGYKAFTTAARTLNEYAVANALDQFPAGNPLYSAILGGSVAGAQQAFNALSGEIHASVGSAMADDSRYVREAITGRLIQSYYGGIGASGGQPIVMAAAAPTNVVEMDTSSRMSLGAGYGAVRAAPPADHDLAWWSRAFGAWGRYDSNGNAATTDRNLGGFVTGVDAGLGAGWRAGLATGYLNTSLSAGGARFSSADINSYVLGAYAGGGVGAFALRTGGTWTWNSIDSSRSVVFPGFFESESASYDGDVGQLFAELAYPIFTHGGVIEPFAGLAYVHVGTDSFTESGPVAGLTSGGLNMNLGYGTLGARAGTTVVWGGTTVIPHASLAWQYAFGDTTPQIALAFASTGIGMGIGGIPLAQNSALLDIGADVVIAQNVTMGVSYMGQYSGDLTDNGVRGRFNWQF